VATDQFLYLSRVQKDRIDLDDEREGGVGDVRPRRHRDGVAEDDHEVVQQKLVCRPFLVIDEHVEEVVDEVADGERDENVDGRVEAADHVVAQRRLEVEGERGPNAGDKRMNKGGQNVPPLPS